MIWNDYSLFTLDVKLGRQCPTADVAQLVEHQVVVLGVAGSIPVIRPV
jgi:hypothetical protein